MSESNANIIFKMESGDDLKKVSEYPRESEGVDQEDVLREEMLKYFDSNHMEPYADGYDSHFKKGKIVEIIEFLESADMSQEEALEPNEELEKEIQKVKALGYDATLPFMEYSNQSSVVMQKMRELSDYMTRRLEESIDISFEGSYSKLLRVLGNPSNKFLFQNPEFIAGIVGLRESMDELGKCRKSILDKDENYKLFEKEADAFMEKYNDLVNSLILEGRPKQPGEQTKFGPLNGEPIDAKAAKELSGTS